MINTDVFRALQMTPGEAAAIALFDRIYETNPGKIKDLLEAHDQKFTGDPNIDFMQIYNLSKERDRFFNDDYAQVCKDCKYFSLGDMFDKLKSGAGKLLDTVAPVAGVAANIFVPGTGGLASGLLSNIGDKLQGAGSAAAPTPSPSPPPAAQNTPAYAGAVTTTFGANQTGPLDSRTDANKIVSLLNTPDTTPQKKILGMTPLVFWITLGAVIVVLIVVTILIIRHIRKKKELEKGHKK